LRCLPSEAGVVSGLPSFDLSCWVSLGHEFAELFIFGKDRRIAGSLEVSDRKICRIGFIL
jgi:hypothetical protein